MTKHLLIILSVFVFGAIMAFTISFNFISAKSNKKVSGVKTYLPKLNQNNIHKPPIKNIDTKEPNILSKSAILIDKVSSKRLYVKNPDEKVPIASTTKIMTAMVILENYSDKLNDTVTVSQRAAMIEGSDIQLSTNEKLTVLDLLKGLLIKSGNDAAYALADHFGGKDDFVKKMNEKAIYLGLTNTKYKDPAGLDDEGYSTSNDLAILASYAMNNNKFQDIVKTKELNIVSITGILHELKNSNRLLLPEEQYYFSNAIGIKTGFTPEAGHCLVSAAIKDNHEIISVILYTNENSLTASAKESRKLLDWGLSNWTW